MKVYNKLVRDLIPQVIKNSGKECEMEIADKEQRTELLEAKLMDEVNDYLVLHIILDIVKRIYLTREEKSLKNVVVLKRE